MFSPLGKQGGGGSGTTYTVSYYGNGNTGGTVPTDTNSPYAANAQVTVLGAGNLVKTGHTFAGWNTQANGNGSPYAANGKFNIAINNTLYAQWTATGGGTTYTVSYYGNGHTGGTVPTDTNSPYAANAQVTVLGAGNLVKTGHTFAGWNTQANGNGTPYAVNGKFNIAVNTTLYAKWTAETYTVTFMRNHDGNDTESLYTKTVTFPATAIGTGDFPADPTRAGYTFDGWYSGADGSGSAFTDSTPVNADVMVYAKWTSETYTVTFKSNYGENNTLYTRTVTLPVTAIGAKDFPSAPSRPGYNFMGWNIASNGLGNGFTATSTVSANTTVYAQWTDEDLITLNPDAGDGAFSQGNFTLSRGGTPNSQAIIITGSDYTNPRWLVDGALKGTGTGITIEAAGYSLGGHSLSLFIVKNGAVWSKDLEFFVTD
jgi:uncharacterized repeat protein (TIGR02543 family)